ncbi:MAG: hypothetical protein ACLUW6_00610 [Coriobacteriaceae bacterium]
MSTPPMSSREIEAKIETRTEFGRIDLERRTQRRLVHGEQARQIYAALSLLLQRCERFAGEDINLSSASCARTISNSQRAS